MQRQIHVQFRKNPTQGPGSLLHHWQELQSPSRTMREQGAETHAFWNRALCVPSVQSGRLFTNSETRKEVAGGEGTQGREKGRLG